MLLEVELRTVLVHVAGVAAAAGGALFLADVALAALARTGHGARRVATLRRLSPPLVRHGAELVVTALFALGAARPAGASVTPVRDWLRRPATTTTTTLTATTATTATPSPAARTTPPSTTPPSTTPPSTATSLPPVTTPSSTVTSLPVTAVAPRTAPTAPAAPPPVTAPPAAERYVVEPGDCLWRIAARRLGPAATNQAIDSAWRAIYAANRAAVGDDPSLIHPGLVLTLPPLAAAH